MTAKLLSADNLTAAVNALKDGEVVGIPTETVYGLAANAFNENAVTRIFRAKDRPLFDPLIVHVPPSWNTLERLDDADITDSSALTPSMRKVAAALLAQFWPGPLTLILPKHARVPDLVTSGLSSVGVRMPSHPVAQKLLELVQLPLAAPSANRFGRISPTSAQDVMAELGDRISLIVDGGASEVGVESTVVTMAGDSVVVLRPGKISLLDLKNALAGHACEISSKDQFSRDATPLTAPGQLASHYAPRKPLFLVDVDAPLSGRFDDKATVGLLAMTTEALSRLQSSIAQHRIIATKVLTLGGGADEAAKNLFSSLRYLDDSPADIIIAEKPINHEGLWYAIADRLTRASAKTEANED